ncbi:MAG: hypothetical protein ACYC3G_03490 [Minisyncoccota bacterium]
MDFKSRLEEVETKAKLMFKERFIGLAEACKAFNCRTPKGNELSVFCSFLIKESQLEMRAKEGSNLFTVPRAMTVDELCSAVPNHYKFGGGLGRDIVTLKKKIITPGRYLVNREPTHLSFDGLMMREGEMRRVFKPRPELARMVYIETLCCLLGKIQLIAENICTTCCEEVAIGRYGKMNVSFLKENKKATVIDVWSNRMPVPNIYPIERA